MNLDHAIWWHVYPLGAVGAPIHHRAETAPVNRLVRLEAWLDYAVELGCSGLLLGPLFASTSHGYDTVDYFRIDPRLGDDAAFDHLIEQAGRRGLPILLDGVFNHVGAAHRLVAEAREAGQGLVRLQPKDGRLEPTSWEGHGDLALLDHDRPDVADLVTAVMLHWLRRGIAGWRLDVAYAVPSAFWASVIDRVRAEFSEAIFLGEVIHGDYVGLARDGHLDSVTQYELWKAIWSSLADNNLWELDWALARHAEFCVGQLPNTFIGNHDVDRIASSVGPDRAALAAAILFSLPGMPSIYYGDEQGFTGTKGSGRDADEPLRPALPDTPDDLAPDGWWLYRLYQQLIGLRRRNPWLATGAVEVLGKDNSWIEYRVVQGSRRLTARVDLEPPAFRLSVAGGESLSWPAN